MPEDEIGAIIGLGKERDGGSARPLLIKLKNEKMKMKVMLNSRKLRYADKIISCIRCRTFALPGKEGGGRTFAPS